MKTLHINTRKRTEFVDITAEIRQAVSDLKLPDGAATIFVPHTTAGITINENADPDVTRDMAAALDRMVPWEAGYHHSEGNAAAHVKASMMGSSVRVLVQNGQLQLGTWQSVYFCEFDGPRSRHFWVAPA